MNAYRVLDDTAIAKLNYLRRIYPVLNAMIEGGLDLVDIIARVGTNLWAEEETAKMTFDDPNIIKVMLENRGVYPGDPPMKRIYSYNRESAYAVFMRPEHDDMHLSPYVRDYQLLMEDGELTEAGRKWLDAWKEPIPI